MENQKRLYIIVRTHNEPVYFIIFEFPNWWDVLILRGFIIEDYFGEVHIPPASIISVFPFSNDSDLQKLPFLMNGKTRVMLHEHVSESNSSSSSTHVSNASIINPAYFNAEPCPKCTMLTMSPFQPTSTGRQCANPECRFVEERNS